MDVGKEREQGAEAFPAIGAPETPALANAGRSYSGLLLPYSKSDCLRLTRGQAYLYPMGIQPTSTSVSVFSVSSVVKNGQSSLLASAKNHFNFTANQFQVGFKLCAFAGFKAFQQSRFPFA
jgi:hypothetical protein